MARSATGAKLLGFSLLTVLIIDAFVTLSGTIQYLQPPIFEWLPLLYPSYYLLFLGVAFFIGFIKQRFSTRISLSQAVFHDEKISFMTSKNRVADLAALEILLEEPQPIQVDANSNISELFPSFTPNTEFTFEIALNHEHVSAREYIFQQARTEAFPPSSTDKLIPKLQTAGFNLKAIPLRGVALHDAFHSITGGELLDAVPLQDALLLLSPQGTTYCSFFRIQALPASDISLQDLLGPIIFSSYQRGISLSLLAVFKPGKQKALVSDNTRWETDIYILLRDTDRSRFTDASRWLRTACRRAFKSYKSQDAVQFISPKNTVQLLGRIISRGGLIPSSKIICTDEQILSFINLASDSLQLEPISRSTTDYQPVGVSAQEKVPAIFSNT